MDLVALAAAAKESNNKEDVTEKKEDVLKEVIAQEKKQSITSRPKPKESKFNTAWYFFCERPNFGFINRQTRQRVGFKGYYFTTTDPKLAAYIQKCYGSIVEEITEQAYQEGVTLKPGDPEPEKSQIVVNKLPERVGG